jgi:hypothetical protein
MTRPGRPLIGDLSTLDNISQYDVNVSYHDIKPNGTETMLIELPDLPYPADALELLNWEFAECLPT